MLTNEGCCWVAFYYYWKIPGDPPKNLIKIIFKQNFDLETQNVASGFKIDGKILPEKTIHTT